MDEPKTHIGRLQALLERLSDGVWEHNQGIVIENLDNPGWSVRLSLCGTPFETLVIEERFDNRSEHDWVHAQTIERGHNRFLEVNCGPLNLAEALDALFEYLT